MTKYLYTTSGTCSKAILLTVEGDIPDRRRLFGRLSGKHPGNQPAGGRNAALKDIVERLKGIRCGSKPTSCPDQLARALEMIEKGELGDNLKELND